MPASANTVQIMSVDESSEAYWAKPKLEGHSVKMQIDTGSKASLVSHKIYKKCMRHLSLCPSDTVLTAYTGHPVHMKGMTDVTVQCNGQTARLPVYVTKRNYPAITGRAWLKEIPLNWQAVRKLSHGATHLQAILEKHEEIFRDELGSMKDITVKLHVKPGSKPVFMKDRPVPYTIRPKVEADLDTHHSGTQEGWWNPDLWRLEHCATCRAIGDIEPPGRDEESWIPRGARRATRVKLLRRAWVCGSEWGGPSQVSHQV